MLSACFGMVSAKDEERREEAASARFGKGYPHRTLLKVGPSRPRSLLAPAGDGTRIVVVILSRHSSPLLSDAAWAWSIGYDPSPG